ncbi:hypothetical protein DOM22_05545 [Bdellovibrio sp. ZAP7]|uniref:heavy metal-binding domain-containing protein n=1 Tax=Bdellovibrio sp. ZAP7 TaxID=2231053 RepID=UPI0011574D64|nr:heavy metal-binding domain-containing protein [Bdellovibrio sp. ZAP7]QDK44662.1 hypothetical protein DOM22_05545 [Bdellovibrio sp. ZAP7]
MSKKQLLTVITIFAVVGLWLGKKYLSSKSTDSKGKITLAEGTSYYTCPMHPFIHMDTPGKCPICHMDLVKVEAQAAETQTAQSDATKNRGSVVSPANLLSLVGVSKHKVEKMNLEIKIPVAGRFNSSHSISFQVYEQDLSLLKTGIKFTGKSPALPDESFEGIITGIDNIVDPTSRTVRVVGQLKNTKPMPSEMTFEGSIDIPLKNKIAIPEDAVLHTGTEDLIYLFSSDNVLSAKSVKLGVHTQNYYEIVDGLQEGDLISSGPNFLIDSESKIRGVSMPKGGPESAPSKPACPKGQHWDVPMAMCMPGEG